MEKKLGAVFLKDNTYKFSVWAPFATEVHVVFKDEKETVALQKKEKGYWEKEISGVKTGSLYKLKLDNKKELSDPASRSQPEGVHSWSELVNLNAHSWNDQKWKGFPISEMIIYELHVGTFSQKGTFEGVSEKLDHLLELGVNTIEIMPIAQFPGDRNWGYDGVYPYAVQQSYGGPMALQNLIDECHQKGIAVLLDVVYNHQGPEGNYLSQFGPYFTQKYKTPWGSAINFDDEQSDEVRNFFLNNALMWLEEFHFDGLRLDAVHEIIDRGATHFLKELSQKVKKLETKTGRQYVLIAESDLNDSRIVDEPKNGGYNLEGQWVDDFHHSVHTMLTGEKNGYYEDFGKMEFVAKTFKQAFVYDGIYSTFRKKTVGNSPDGLPPYKFVVCVQNHDQMGNRMLGERLSKLISFEKLKLAAGILMISPFVPMLFMGEEFAEVAPFQYFVSHGDPQLVKAVQEGRKREFEYFNHGNGEFTDPQAQETFKSSKLNWNFKENPPKNIIFEYYKMLIRLRKKGDFNNFKNKNLQVETEEGKQLLTISAEENGNILFVAANFGSESLQISLPKKNETLEIIFASADKKWGGENEFPKEITGLENFRLSPESLVVFRSF